MLDVGAPLAWDDFTSAVPAAIRTVSWQGAYCRTRGPAVAGPPSAASSSFRVGFYLDISGRPPNSSTPRYEVIFTSAEVHEQFAFDAVRGDADCAYYNYWADLPIPFPVEAGIRYWLFIRADTGRTGLGWGWRVGVQDNSISWTGSLRGVFTSPKDVAFSLSSR